MLFTEPAFVFFLFPVLLGLYFWTPRRLRNVLLLVASLFFYWWGEKLFFLMVISITMNYCLGLLVGREDRPRLARACLVLGIVGNLGLLGIYKYGAFAVDTVNDCLNWLGWFELDPVPAPTRHLPIGISFFTFQAMSYVIDVHRGRAERQANPINLGLYISLFPQLIAGPIVRYRDVAKQIRDRHVVFADFSAGLQRFIVGMGKKMLLANSLGATCDIIFRLPAAQLVPGVAWLGIVCFMVQLYLDFSGYSDMAIGLGRMFGFRFPENFLYPYISRSIGEMWQRWHITLGTWLRDYLYIPLGSNKQAGNWKINRNLIIVFLACGLWHGAYWNFVIWGIWNGIFLLFERTPWGRKLKQAWYPIPWLYTCAVWIFGLVLFKAGDPKIAGNSLGKALAYAGRLLGLGDTGVGAASLTSLWNWELSLGLACGIVACFPVAPWLRRRYAALREAAAPARRNLLDRCWHYGRLIALVLILLLSVELIASSAYNPFLYTQF